MLRFNATPDEIFVAMLDSGIANTTEVVLAFDEGREEQQQDTFACHLPRSSTIFTWHGAKEELKKLRAALHEDALYQITDYHWLLLYESLRAYCDSYNEIPWGEPSEKYGIESVDFDWVVDIFFWDTDFLLQGAQHISEAGRKGADISDEAVGISSGKKPASEDLEIERCNDEWAKEFNQGAEFYFTPGMKTYPSPPDDSIGSSLPN